MTERRPTTILRTHAAGKWRRGLLTSYLECNKKYSNCFLFRSSYGKGKGGCVCLQEEMLRNLYNYANSFYSSNRKPIEVSSIAGSSHSANSNHYRGTTFDVPCKRPKDHCKDLENFCRLTFGPIFLQGSYLIHVSLLFPGGMALMSYATPVPAAEAMPHGFIVRSSSPAPHEFE